MSRFAFVAAERANHAVATLCRIIGASVSGFYAWLRAIPATRARAEAEAELRRHIGRVFAAGRRVYGSPRIHAELRREGRRHSRRRVARLMREMGLSARRGRRRPPRTTDSRHDLPVAPNLLDRHFDADRPDTVWLADISYLPTDEGWLYLAAIEDLATREVVGWSMELWSMLVCGFQAATCSSAACTGSPSRKRTPWITWASRCEPSNRRQLRSAALASL